MIMKQFFIAMALLLSLNAGQATAAQKSTHQRHQALTEQASHQGKTVKMDKDDSKLIMSPSTIRQKPINKALKHTAIHRQRQQLMTVLHNL